MWEVIEGFGNPKALESCECVEVMTEFDNEKEAREHAELLIAEEIRTWDDYFAIVRERLTVASGLRMLY